MKVSTSPDFLQSVMAARWKAIGRDTDPVPELATIWDRCIGLEWDDGGFFFFRVGDGVYEVHTQFLEGAKNPLACAREAVAHMFTHTDCTTISTMVPADNIPAGRLTLAIGGEYVGSEPRAFLRNGELHDIHYYALTKDGWLRATEGQ